MKLGEVIQSSEKVGEIKKETISENDTPQLAI